MKKQKPQCGCLGAPMRALSRACDSACNLYVRGMSGAARHMPSSAADAVGRGGYGRSPTSSPMIVGASSDRVEDLVRAAAKQKQGRRVAPEEVKAADATGTGKKGAAPRQGSRVAPAEVADVTGLTKSAAPVSAAPGNNKVGAAAGMETIAEDAPCEFDACALPPPSSRRRGAAAGGGLATQTGGFGAVRAGSQVYVR